MLLCVDADVLYVIVHCVCLISQIDNFRKRHVVVLLLQDGSVRY